MSTVGQIVWKSRKRARPTLTISCLVIRYTPARVHNITRNNMKSGFAILELNPMYLTVNGNEVV